MNGVNINIPRVELEIVRGQARRKRRPVNVPAFLIGTSRDCDLVLGDPNFAEVHAYLILHSGGVSIRHLGFGPDIFVNEKQFGQGPLYDGDRVRTGPYEFVVHIDSRVTNDDPVTMRQLRAGARISQARECNSEGLTAVRDLLRDVRSALEGSVRTSERHVYDRSA